MSDAVEVRIPNSSVLGNIITFAKDFSLPSLLPLVTCHPFAGIPEASMLVPSPGPGGVWHMGG